MPESSLTKTHILEGIWRGILTRDGEGGGHPALTVQHEGRRIDGVSVRPMEPGQWEVRVPIPPETLSDGLQTYVIIDTDTGDTLDTFALLAGEALAHDIRAEINLLRAELDMLKRAFRRHCLETTG